MQHSSPTRKLAFISQLRFPLAALVVLIHSNISGHFTVQGEQMEMARRVIHGFSVGLPSFAVPLFFAISGYLFFYGIQDFTAETYRKKLQRRIKTLLIPYVLWNCIAFLLFSGRAIVKGEALSWPLSPDIWWGCRQLATSHECVLGYTIEEATAPLLVPLWFMRDLMLLVLLSPIIHFLLKRMGWILVLLAGILFHIHLYPNWGGISIMGLPFFCSGAVWAIQGKDPLAYTKKWIPASSMIAILSLLAYVTLWNRAHWAITDMFNAIFVWSGMLVAIHWANHASRKHPIPKMLSESSFFIYAVHSLFLFVIKPVTQHVQHMGLAVILAAYFGCYLLTLLLSVLSFKVVAWAEHGHGILTGIWNKAPTRQ